MTVVAEKKTSATTTGKPTGTAMFSWGCVCVRTCVSGRLGLRLKRSLYAIDLLPLLTPLLQRLIQLTSQRA